MDTVKWTSITIRLEQKSHQLWLQLPAEFNSTACYLGRRIYSMPPHPSTAHPHTHWSVLCASACVCVCVCVVMWNVQTTRIIILWPRTHVDWMFVCVCVCNVWTCENCKRAGRKSNYKWQNSRGPYRQAISIHTLTHTHPHMLRHIYRSYANVHVPQAVASVCLCACMMRQQQRKIKKRKLKIVSARQRTVYVCVCVSARPPCEVVDDTSDSFQAYQSMLKNWKSHAR